MSEDHSARGDQHERLDRKIHHDLANLGWRIPQTEPEVRAAEESANRWSGDLPERLHDTPDDERSQTPERILGRYLRDDARYRSPDDVRAKDAGDSKRDLERE